MKITLAVEQTDGLTYQVTTNLFSIVALERKFKIRASELSSGVAMEHLAFLAFEGAKQSGITVPAVFDDYIKRLVSVDVVGEDAANPTDEAVTSEPSAS
jgi:hypothetical protein